MSRVLHVITVLSLILTPLLGSGVPPRAALSATPVQCSGDTSPPFYQTVQPGQTATIAYDGATIVLDANAVSAATNIGIAPINQSDIATLDVGLANTTLGPTCGYRFFPVAMHFNDQVQITVPYDPTLIPGGMTEQDVFTYFFDEQSGVWTQLDRVSVDTVAHTITSSSDHFTDLINATDTVPDHPQALADDPNAIKGLKAADPAAGINLMKAPEGTSSGDATTAYPIDLPDGRGDVQPDLSITYSSNNGDGWLGEGWELSTLALAVETRWGVPRYDAINETESYILNGDELTPISRVNPLVPRNTSGDKTFHVRVEGGFQKIIRHGNTPLTYRWEVVNKGGTHFFYGGDSNAVDPNSTLGGPNGIFKWALRETIDPHGNTATYAYEHAHAPVTPGASVLGDQLYLKSINYVGYNSAPGAYTVTFLRDNGVRPDITSEARGGFLTVTADRLSRIEVRFNGAMIRAYDLAYTVGPFYTSLLKSITQSGANGTPFNTHSFTYYNEIQDNQGNYQGFGPSQAWQSGNDNVSEGLDGFGAASAISGSVGNSPGGHIYIGFNPEGGTKSLSIGGKIGFNYSATDTALALVDLTGHGLPDKVFSKSGKVYFRLNESGAHPSQACAQTLSCLGDAHEITSLEPYGIGSEHSFTISGGPEAYVSDISAVYNHAETFTTGSVYFDDVNHDGLPDLVVNGTVYFNHLDANGIPTFTPDSTGTRVPIGPSTVDTNGIVPDFSQVLQQAQNQFPLQDTVRRWTAPYAGHISITGTVTLQKDPSGKTGDGVRTAIQQNGNELWSSQIAGTDVTAKTPTNVSSLTVNAGDRIYFRVGSVDDGRYDQVAWDPQIQYLNVAPTPDVNGLDAYHYQASKDFTLAGRPGITTQMPFNGTLRVSGNLVKKAATTDDVTLEVLKNGAVAFSKTLTSAQANATITLSPTDNSNDVTVSAGDSVALRVKVDSPIDVTQIQWTPSLFYVATTGTNAPPATDKTGNFVIRFNPPYDIDLYPQVILSSGQTPGVPQQAWVAPKAETIGVTPTITYHPVSPNGPASGLVTLTVKRPGALLGKETFGVSPGSVTAPSISVSVNQGDAVYFDLSASDPMLGAGLSSPSVQVNDGSNTFSAPSALHVPYPIDTKDNANLDPSNTLGNGLFNQLYRGWAFAGYNGNGGRATAAIDETKLVFNQYTNKSQVPQQAFNPGSCPKGTSYWTCEAQSGYVDPTQGSAYVYYPDPADSVWHGPSSSDAQAATAKSSQGLQQGRGEIWVASGGMSSSRVGADHLEVPNPGAVTGAGAQAVERLSHAGQDAGSVGVGFLNGSASTGTGHGTVDYLDMNGSGFPAVVANGHIQYPNELGVLEAHNQPITQVDDVRTSGNDAFNVGIGGNVAEFKVNSKGQGDAPQNSTPKENADQSQMATVGFSGGLGTGDATTNCDLIDVNGDGLPDRVCDNNGQLAVQFNLGYAFSPQVPWSAADISKGTSNSASLGIEVGFNDDIYGFAGGANLSQESEFSKGSLVDLKGNSRPDYVTRDGNGAMTVAFNTGNGFATPVAWNGASIGDSVSSSAHVGLGGGGYFTIAIGPLCLVACFLIINPGFDFTHSMGRQESGLMDVNGAGQPDLVASTDDGTLNVALNNTGRTNLLKTISRPLGGTISLEYQRDGNTYDMPHSRWILSKTTVDDGQSGDGADTQVTAYQYQGGKYNQLERDFYGYAQVTEQHLDDKGNVYRSVERTYSNDNYYDQGLLNSEVTRDAAGNKFLETDNSFFLSDVANPGVQLANPASTTATAFPGLERTDKKFFEGQATAGKTTSITYQYDALGNTTQYFDAGDPGQPEGVQATITYASCPGSYIMESPIKIEVTNNATELRHRESNVDCATGNVTQIREYLANGSAAVTDMTYDQFGNLQQYTGPANLHGQRYQLTYGYDPDVQNYVTSIQNSFGLSSSSVYNPLFGVPTSTTDTNKNTISYTYDEFGRPATITGPLEQGGPTPTIRYEHHPNDPVPWALTRNLDSFRGPGATIDTVTFVDGLDRAIETKKSGTVFTGATTAPQDVMVVSGRVTFDFAGRTIEEFYPITEPLGTPGTFNPTHDSVQPTRTSFDILDRMVKSTRPDNVSTTMAYGFGADRSGTAQFMSTATDADGNQTNTFTNVRKLTTGVERFLGSQPVWMSYTYDPMQEMLSATDDKNNVTTMAYDNLGRRTSLANPNTSQTDATFDLASNVIARVTANLRQESKQISYDFDFTRLRSIAYPDFPGNNVTYTYGDPGAPNNGAGRIIQVNDESGSVQRSYDQLGQITQEVETIPSKNGGKGPNSTDVYTTAYVHDTWGRLQNMTYPDGELLTYQYDSGGLVRAAAGEKLGNGYPYLNRFEYDKFGERVFILFGNGVTTQYTYQPDNRRLTNLQSTTPTGTTFQNLNYTYDPVGNVLGLANAVAVPPASQMGGPTSQTYNFDSLYRLTSAAGTFQSAPGKTRQYTDSLSYDTVDDILGKTQTDTITEPGGKTNPEKKTSYDFTGAAGYLYQGAQPNAPTHIGVRSYTYDANGNETGWTNDKNGTRRTITWDEENRVQQIADNGHKMNYLYDDQGNRRLAYGPHGQTAYVNAFFTIRNSSVGTKNVFVGTTRILSKPMKNATNAPAPIEAAEYYYHDDQLGSTGYVTEADGSIYQHLEYFPFGESWVEEHSNTNNTPYLFTGQLLDDDTELYYYGARYYDPRVGQFISTDPALMSDPQKATTSESPALYSYAKDNPVTYTDPDGRDVIIAKGHEDATLGPGYIDAVAKKMETALKGTYGAEHIKVVYYEGVKDAAEKIVHDGGKVSAFIYIGHGTSDRGGELMTGASKPEDAFPSVETAVSKAQVSDNGTVVILGCRILGGGNSLKAADSLKKRKVRVIGSALWFHTKSTGQAATTGSEDDPREGYANPEDLRVGTDVRDATELSPKEKMNNDPSAKSLYKYQSVGTAVIDARDRVEKGLPGRTEP